MLLPSQVAPADPAQDRAARHGKVLEELAEIGLDLARALRREVTEADTPADVGQVALAFSRIARAVRLTLALEDRLGEDHAARAQAAEDERAERAAEQARARIKLRHDAAINRDLARVMVEETIEAETDGREAEPLLAALREKLDEVDEADFAQLPVDAIVMRICKDLGVTYDPALWDDEDEDDDEDDPAPYASQDSWDAPRKPIPVWDPATCRFQPP